MTDNTDLTLDPNFIPANPGVIFHATFPNPIDDIQRTLVTLADGQLLEITKNRNRILSRADFVKSGSSTVYHLDALRAKIAHVFPTSQELRRLPRNEQYALLDQIDTHLGTADGMMINTAGEILRERRDTADGRHQWLTHEVYVDTFDLWDCGNTPIWDQDTAPVWAPTMTAPHAHTALTTSTKSDSA